MNSKRRRAVVAVVVAIAALMTAVLAPAGQAAKRGPTCKRAHSRTVAQNGAVRVFKIRRNGVTTLYACRKSTGRRSKLDKSFDDGVGEQEGTFFAVRLRGNYVAWISSFTDNSCKASCPPGFEPTTLSIEVFNVRNRRTRSVKGSPIGKALVVSKKGGVAWATRDSATAPVQIRGSVRAGDDHLIDSGNIDPKSLAIEITIISWTRDGKEYFARLR